MDAEHIRTVINLRNRIEADFRKVLELRKSGDKRAAIAAVDFIQMYVTLDGVLKQRMDEAYELSKELFYAQTENAQTALSN